SSLAVTEGGHRFAEPKALASSLCISHTVARWAKATGLLTAGVYALKDHKAELEGAVKDEIVPVQVPELVLDVAPTVEDSKVKVSAEDIVEDSATNDTPVIAPSLVVENTEMIFISKVPVLSVILQNISRMACLSSDEAELNNLEPLSQPANIEATQAKDAVSQGALPDNKPEDDVPSVTAEAAEVTINTAAVFPNVLSTIKDSKKSKSSNLCRTTLEENATSEGSLASPDPPSPVTGCSQLQLMTYSYFFPGGWFSPTKTVNET
ncbi:hypothetical protein DXG01_014718, partial [Tephrocybe rancida]